jgi:hypothetical protein
MSGRATALVLTAALACALAGPAGAAGPAPPRCPPRGQAALIEEAGLVVYRPKIGPGATPVLPVVACLRGTSTRMTLVPTPEARAGRRVRRGGNLRLIAASAPVVAYVVSELTGVDTSASRLVVADVSSRTILREAPAGYGVDGGFVFSQSVSDLVVTADGELAWIVQSSGFGRQPSQAAVLAAPRTGPAVVLDEGPGVAPQSLYLSGGTVHWVDGSETRGAALP